LLDRGRDPILGVVRPTEKRWESVLRALRSKQINNGCNAADRSVSHYTVPVKNPPTKIWTTC